MVTNEVMCKSLLNPSKLAVYCINPYVGCQHACSYCYANPITRMFSRHSEPWGEFVDVKVNAPEVLRKEIRGRERGQVFISSLTDAYQPLEKKYDLTRKLLGILLENQFPVCIQTKSSLVTRDIDLLKKFNEKEVGFTIMTLDESVRKNFEPFSSSIKERLDALKLLKENRINTYIFAGPLLPYLSDKSLEELIGKASELKVDYIWFDKLNLKPGVWDNMERILQKHYPHLLPLWKEVFFSKNDYYDKLKERLIQFCKENNVRCRFCY
jgi:DNA repair photolyase